MKSYIRGISYLSDLEVGGSTFPPRFMIYGHCKNVKLSI